MDEMKKTDPMQTPLADAELEEVTGGGKDFFDSKGRAVGYTAVNSYYEPVIRYRACPKCGKAMHMGKFNFYYCDPCDYWAVMPDLNTFYGSEREFMRTMVD